MAVEFNSAASYGISTGAPDFRALYEKIGAQELERLKPNEALQDKFKVSQSTWQEARTILEKVHLAADVIADNNKFGGFVATSSDPDIITATASSLAEPGVHKVVVDRLAQFHQIGSQRYASADTKIGQGEILIGFEDERLLSITIDQTNDTIQGLADTINNLKIDIDASLKKIGNSEFPYQLLLTSNRSGEEGRIVWQSSLVGGEEPLFNYRYEQPTKWYYAPGKKIESPDYAIGSSSSIPKISGEFTGEDEVKFNFQVINGGQVGSSDNPSISWSDTTGRSGVINLGQYQYSPNTNIEIADGMIISFSDGYLVQNDSFSVTGSPASGPFLGFIGSDTPAMFSKTSTWNSQKELGKATVQGYYTGSKTDYYTINVVKGGVVGTSPEVVVEYESENGQKGILNFGLGYTPGQGLSIGNGLTLSIPSGALQDSYSTRFAVEPTIPSDRWWLFEDGNTNDKPSLFTIPVDWAGEDQSNIDPDVYDPRSKKSNAPKSISGQYMLDEDKQYKFTARGEGRIGINEAIYIEWEDNKGNKGNLEVGKGYRPGTELKFDGGLNLILEDGYIFDGDYFFAAAFSPTIQAAQDAQIRLQVNDSGQGGQIYTSPTNEIDDAITGVNLNLISASEKTVTITISEDIEKVKEAIIEFVNSYNDALVFIKEATKYDPETQIAGPLQADRALIYIQEQLREILVDAIPGLPTDANTLPYAGISINKDGLIDFDPEKLDAQLIENYEKVVNIFRNNAITNNSGIRYFSSSTRTINSGEIGYNVNVDVAPKSGYFESAVIDGPINIPAGENQYIIEVDGRQSDALTLESGIWSIKQLARELTKKINKDNKISDLNPKVSIENKKIVIQSATFGNSSNINIVPLNNANIPFLNGAQSINGIDVQGSINGNPAIGSGQFLAGSKGFPEEDLRFYVNLTQNQLNASQPEANAVFSVGKGTITKRFLDEQLKKNEGPVDTSISTFGNRVENLEDRLNVQRERIERKKERLAQQLVNAEKKIGELRSQQSDMISQGLINR